MTKNLINRLVLFGLLCFSNQAYAQRASILPPELPVKIDVRIDLYKVYDISTVDETYKVDGYFSYSWTDPREAYDPDSVGTMALVYTNDRVDNLIEDDLWFPQMMIINASETRETAQKSITISPSGKITYVERFYATLKEELEYHLFPFDQQNLVIEIEPFVYDSSEVIINSLLFGEAANAEEGIESEDWVIDSTWAKVESRVKGCPVGDEAQLKHQHGGLCPGLYSHARCVIKVSRLPGYYLWQLIFPLMIIMLTSIVILWIEDFATQIGIGFTLMLTVVAFNFFSETLLPKLPYNTFIEILIMLGYIFICICIVGVVYIERVESKNLEKGKRIERIFRILYPIIFIASIFISSVMYFGTWIRLLVLN